MQFGLAALLTATILSITLAMIVARLSARLRAVEIYLDEAERQAIDAAADRDRIQAELAQSRERLADARSAAGRAQVAAERELRMRSLLREDRRFSNERSDGFNNTLG